MSHARYERLHSAAQDEDSDVRRSRHPNTIRYNDDENEEIELNKHDDDDAENVLNDSYRNGHIGSGEGEDAAGGGSHRAIGRQHDTRSIIAADTQLPGSRFMQLAIGTLATILLYLSLSICLTFYQKSLIQKLRFPISIVSYHLVIKFMLAALIRAIYKCHTGKSRVQLDWRSSVRKMAPTGIASGIDIGFSNWGLELVPISLYTMTKSSTIVFILFFAILLGLEKKSWSLVLIVGLIAAGLFMFTYKSTQFDALGFLFILVASLSSGIRWSFAQFVMQKSKLGLHNPVDMIYFMQPWMIAALVPFLITFEGQKLYDILRDLSDVSNERIYWVIAKITFAALLAFLMEVSEFMVLMKTSSLTLSIAGIFKDICQLALAVELNNDQLSLTNVFGLVVCLAGICCHLIHKYATLKRLEELNALDDDLEYNETSVSTNASAGGMGSAGNGGNGSGNNGGGAGNHITIAMLNKKHSSQTVPLLEQQTDSDNDSNSDGNEQNASDVIFDVLKRRDMQR